MASISGLMESSVLKFVFFVIFSVDFYAHLFSQFLELDLKNVLKAFDRRSRRAKYLTGHDFLSFKSSLNRKFCWKNLLYSRFIDEGDVFLFK